MNPKNFILIFFLAFITYCFTFGKLDMTYKELYGNTPKPITIKEECKNADGSTNWQCYFKNPANLDLAPCTKKDEDGNDVISYYCNDKLWYTRKKPPCLSELNNEENLIMENDFPKTKLYMKIENQDIKKYISKEWDAKNKIDYEGKQILPNECIDHGNDGTPDEVEQYFQCTGINEGEWNTKTTVTDSQPFYYEKILRIFPKEKNQELKTILIDNLEPYTISSQNQITEKKYLQDFNKLKYNANLNSEYLKKYAETILIKENLDMNTIFFDTNNIAKERLDTDDYKFGKGIKFVHQDFEDADKYAYAKLCLSKGYCLSYDEDGEFTCQFDKKQCIDNSKKAADVGSFTKDDDGNDTEEKPKYKYHEWRKGIGCINGDENIVNFCSKKNQCNYKDNYWKYDKDHGTCKLGPKYCETLGLELRDGKCKTAEGQLLAEGLAGQTFVRNGRRKDAYSTNYQLLEKRICPPYKVEYKRLADSKDSDASGDFIGKCLDPENPTKNEEDYYSVFDPGVGGESDFKKYGKYIPIVGDVISLVA